MESKPPGDGLLATNHLDPCSTIQLSSNKPLFPVRLNITAGKKNEYQEPEPWSVLNKCPIDLIVCNEEEYISLWDTFESSLWNEPTLDAENWKILNRLSIYEDDPLDTALNLSFDYLLLIEDDDLFSKVIYFIIDKANRCLETQRIIDAGQLFDDKPIISISAITNIYHFHINSFDFHFSVEDLKVAFNARQWQDLAGITEKNIFQKCGFCRATFRLIKITWQLRSLLNIIDDYFSSRKIINPYNFSRFEQFLLDIVSQVIDKPTSADKRNFDIILDRIGAVDGKPKTLEVIGQKYFLTRERVRQVEKEYLENLTRKSIQKSLLTFCVVITEILANEGGIISLTELADKVCQRFRWASPPCLAPLIWILQFNKEFQVDKKQKYVCLEFEMEAKRQKCVNCDKLVFIIQEMLVLNQSRISLDAFIGKIRGICKKNCNSRVFSPQMVDRDFVANLLVKNRGLYVIDGEYVISVESLECKDDHKFAGFEEQQKNKKLNDSGTILILTKDGKATQSVQAYTRPANVVLATPPKPALDPEVIEKLTDVLSAHFANGCRLNSPIELARFRSFAAEDFGEEILLPDEELKRYISACGTTYDGKVYAVSAETKERIKELVDGYFSDGAQAIFFAEFYAKNENWLSESSVVSEDMLIDILRRLFPNLSFTQTYFGYTDASVFAALEGEILRVWGDDILLTYGQFAERLRYIPLERIKSLLGQNADFIWSSVETFSHVSRIEITDEERQVIREAAVRECNARGYALITDLPFGEIEERNYELSITALHNAVYRICLSDKFDKKGKIVAPKGDVFDALTIMKKYCRTIDKCSLDDLLTYEKELTGEVHRWIPMEAGNTVLVRIDKNTYVADRYVHLNADIIDEAIGLFVKEDYLPLKFFTTFGAFPECGQTWNLFLLESYCRRFSRKFRFDTPSVNSRNAGAVIRKSCGMDYTEIMTDAVANADVPLKDTAVGKFLYESGYTGRSTTAKVNEIIDKARAIRERGD
jgi:hypothetical protein